MIAKMSIFNNSNNDTIVNV